MEPPPPCCGWPWCVWVVVTGPSRAPAAYAAVKTTTSKMRKPHNLTAGLTSQFSLFLGRAPDCSRAALVLTAAFSHCLLSAAPPPCYFT
jgi:hypothetical protein